MPPSSETGAAVLAGPALSQPEPHVDGIALADRATRRTVLIASLVGTTIEWYDFLLYATAATIVFNHGFFPSQNSTLGTLLAFATFAVGFVMRSGRARPL